MPTIGIADVLVKPSFKGLQRSVGRELDGVAESAGKSSGSKMSNALGKALKIGAAAQGLVTGGIIGVALTKGFGRLQAIENAKASLSGLGHSAESVKGIMDNALESVKGTAFGLGEAATVAANAVAAGVKPGKDLERTLKLTGDAATIAGVGMDEMGAIFGKVASSNKIQGDVIAQLNDAGIPIVQLMAKELGKTSEETVKLASAGKINFATFQNAMEKGLGGAALKSGQTLQGAFDNTMAAIGRIGANLLSGVYPKIRDFFAGAINWLKPLEEGAKVAGVKIGEFIDRAMTGAQGLYDLIVKGDYTGKLREAFGWAEDSQFVGFLMTVRDEVKKIPAALKLVVDKSKDVAKFLWDMREPIGVIVGLIVLSLIPHWVALGVEAIKSAVKQKFAWAMARGAAIKAAFVHSGAVAAMIGGWILMGAQATVQAVKIAAGWLIAMGPVGWIIGAIAALVAGFVWAYNNVGWFKDGVDSALRAVGGFFNWLWTGVIKPVFDGIAAVIGWVYNSVIKPVFDGISAAVKWVGDVFTAFYNTAIKPVFDSISVIVGGFYLFFRGIFQLVVSVIQNIVIPLFKFFWDRMVEAFAGIGNTIAGWWNFAVGIFNGAVGFIRDVFAAIFTWLYNTIIKPVFDAIGAAIGWVWNNILKPIFDTWVWVFRNILGPAFNWLWQNVIKPAFDGIGAAIKWAWENVIKPVFDTLSNFIQKTIPDAFKKGVDFVKTAWDRIQDIAKAPVRFVVDTVINDGLIGAFNTIAGILPGVDKLPRVALPPGFMNGGYTGNGGKDEPAGIVHGGEFVFTKEQTRKAGVSNLYAMAKSLAGYANGGFVNPLKSMALTQGYNRIHKGIDLAAGVGTPVFATESGRVSWSGPGVRSGNVWGGNEIHVDGRSGIQEWFAHLSSMAVRVGDMVRAGQEIGRSGNTGITSGPHLHFGTFAGGWPNDINPLGVLSGAGVPSGGGFNPLAAIIDGLLSKFKSAFPMGGFIADAAIGVGKKLFGGITDLITGGQGSAAGNPALYDLGGILPPGVSQVVNRTGKPEAILNPQQWADISRLAADGGGRGGVNINGPIHVRDENALARVLMNSQRDAQAAYGF